MENFDNQVSDWWEYIDSLILYELPIPLPIDVSPSFTFNEEADETSIQHNVRLFEPSRNKDQYFTSIIKKFLIPQEDLIQIDEFCPQFNPTSIVEVMGHEAEMSLYEDAMDNILEVAYKYLMTVEDKFVELSSVDAFLRVCRNEDENSKALQIDHNISHGNELMQEARRRFGNFKTFHIRSQEVLGEMVDLYGALQLTVFTDRREFYEVGPEEYYFRVSTAASTNPELSELIDAYKFIYHYYYIFLQEYVKLMRPVIHDRLYHYQLRYSIMNEHGNMFEGLEALYDNGQDDVSTGTCIEDHDGMSKALRRAIKTIKDPDSNTMCVYYPWDISLVRFQLNNDGGPDDYECNHR